MTKSWYFLFFEFLCCIELHIFLYSFLVFFSNSLIFLFIVFQSIFFKLCHVYQPFNQNVIVTVMKSYCPMELDTFEHFLLLAVKPAMRSLCKISRTCTRCSSNVLLKTIVSSVRVPAYLSVQPRTKSISLWHVEGAAFNS